MKIIQFIIEHKVISGFIGVIILSIIAYVKDEICELKTKEIYIIRTILAVTWLMPTIVTTIVLPIMQKVKIKWEF